MIFKQKQNTASKLATIKPTLSASDAVALIVGLVINAGIFETPSLVAANAENATMAVVFWVLGGRNIINWRFVLRRTNYNLSPFWRKLLLLPASFWRECCLFVCLGADDGNSNWINCTLS
jgi:hypothetical protein